MIDDVRSHVSDTLSYFGIDVSFEVYDCESGLMPSLGADIVLKQKYVVCCEVTEFASDIERAFGVQLMSAEGIVFWFAGPALPRAKEQDENVASVHSGHDSYHHKLPMWLDNYIFDELDACHAPSGPLREFDVTLAIDEPMLQRYLGTYFPRSYTETFIIFENLFSSPHISASLSQNKILSIASLGVGTGGDLLGLLDSIANHFLAVEEVNVYALDGNSESIKLCASIVTEAQKHLPFVVNFECNLYQFDSLCSVDNLPPFLYEPYDFIITSKMLNEIISSKDKRFARPYYDFCRLMLPRLSTFGLCLILDVTAKPRGEERFVPQIMNEQISEAVRDMPFYRSLLPIKCSQHERECVEGCFTSMSFFVSHSGKLYAECKVSYRVIAWKEYVDRIALDRNDEILKGVQRSNLGASDNMLLYSR